MKVAFAAFLALVLIFPSSAQDKPDAKKVTSDPVGTWKVIRTFFAGTKDETKDEFTLTITRDGARLLGRATWQDGEPLNHPETLFAVTLKDGALSFRTGRGQHVGDYSGKLEGDTLVGSMALFIVNGTWEAKRVTAEKLHPPKGEIAALELKLIGSWDGRGPCDGKFVFRTDGAFELTGYGPGRDEYKGKWTLRWNALPPTLVLTYPTLGTGKKVDKTLELRLLKLDGKSLAVAYPNPRGGPTNEYVRDGHRIPASVKSAKINEGELHGKWQSDVDGVFEQSTLEVSPGGEFRLEHRDFALGWSTTLVGSWKFERGLLALTVRDRLQDGRPVPVGEMNTEELSAEFRSGEWTLSNAKGSKMKRVKKGK